MHASKAIPPPENWQDFETLCKKLWGEIWDCPEIKKNGRRGDAQHGVDVYGKPNGNSEYYGIQCKGKDNYTDKKLTKTEIDEEIEKAKIFQPPLKKLYFATTAVKNAEIETYIRIKDQESTQKGLFEVHLFSWEDIVDLIEENKKTFDWYVKSQGFHKVNSVQVEILGHSNGVFSPRYEKTILKYYLEAPREEAEMIDISTTPYNPVISDVFAQNYAIFKRFDDLSSKAGILEDHSYLSKMYNKKYKVNSSLCATQVKISNTGTQQIENWQLFMNVRGRVILKETNIVERNPTSIFLPDLHISDISITGNQSLKISPSRVQSMRGIVSGLSYSSDEFFIEFLEDAEPSKINIEWQFYSKHFQDSGTIELNVEPDYEIVRDFRSTTDPKEEGKEIESINPIIKEVE